MITLRCYADAKTEALAADIAMQIYLVDDDQLLTLYSSNAPPTQKYEADLQRKQRYLVVSLQNYGDVAVTGKLAIRYKRRADWSFIKIARLDPNMTEPDYFVWCESGTLVLNYDRFPDMGIEWTRLRPLKPPSP